LNAWSWVPLGRLRADGGARQRRHLTLYDVDSQQRIGDPITVSQDAAIDVNPAGTELSIAGPDGIVIWSLDRAVWIDAACRIADRQLTAAERDTYLAGLDQEANTCQSVV